MQTHGFGSRSTGPRPPTCRETISSARSCVPLARIWDQYEEVFYEGYGPGGGALMIQAQTDNRNRTVGEVRAVLTRAGGTLGENGSVGWMFDQTGMIEVPTGSADPDEIALVAIDAGASDIETEDGVLIVYTDPTDLHRTREALISARL